MPREAPLHIQPLRHFNRRFMREASANDACPQRGTWPGPNGGHYLNEFNDGNCGVLIQSADLPDTGAGIPSAITMDAGTWYVEATVNINPGSSITISSSVTLVLSAPTTTDFGGFVNVNGSLTIGAGVNVQARCPNCGFVVSEQGGQGQLSVNGTPESPVTMSGSGPGSWLGLVIRAGSTVTINGLHLDGAGAGTEPCSGCDAYHDGIYINRDSPTIRNSAVSNTAGDGIEVDGSDSAPTLSGLTLNGNTGYAIQYDFLTPTLTNISGLKMSGNGHDAVRMGPSSDDVYGSSLDVAWPNLGYPIIDDIPTTVTDGAHLTVAPGATIEFGSGDQLLASGGTTITMNGTAAQPITLTSDNPNPVPGAWVGLIVTPNSTVALNHVHLSYAGAAGGCPCGNSAILIDTASPTISNTTIDYSGSDGIIVARGGQPLLSGVTLANNAGYPLHYQSLPNNLGQFGTLTMSGNGQNALYLDASGPVSGTVSWPNFGVPYLLNGSYVQVYGYGSRLTVAPGVTLRFVKGQQEYLEIRDGSTLTMNGTAAQPITLTSAQARPAPGDWGTILYETGSAGSLSHVHISYGGNCYCGTDTLFVQSANLPVTDTTIDHSNGNDVEVSWNGKPVMHNDTFGAVPSGHFGVVDTVWNPGQPLIDATHDCWGAQTGPFNPKSNPQGKGTPAGDGISYRPWLGQGTTAADRACGAPPPSFTPRFTWRMADRFGQLNANGMINLPDPNDPRIGGGQYCDLFAEICSYVHPSGYSVSFDACTSTSGGPIATYEWKIVGHGLNTDLKTSACALPNPPTFPEQGAYTVTLTITDQNGQTASTTQVINLKDYLIVAVGDSYASGEGNPDSPQQYDSVGLVKRGPRWEDSTFDPGKWDRNVHSQCHRSEYAGQAQAALTLERADPHTSVTFISLACSGAGIVQGLLGPYPGVEPPVDGETLPPQIDQLAHILCFDPRLGCPGPGARPIDALLVSIGGNDAHFADLIQKCVLDNSPPNPFGPWGPGNPNGLGQGGINSPCYDDDRVTGRLQSDLANLPRLYVQLGNAIRQKLDVGKTYITEYPDPTRGDNGGWCGDGQNPGILGGYITLSEAQWASSSVVDALNSVIQRAAGSEGWEYVGNIASMYRGDPAHHIPGHGYCARDHWFRQMLESAHLQGPAVAGFNDALDTKGTMHPNSDTDLQTHEVFTGGQWVTKIRLLDHLVNIARPGIQQVTGSAAPVFDGKAMHVYALGRNYHLLEFYKAPNPAPWQAIDISAALKGVRITGTPVPWFDGNAMHVYAIGTNQHLLEFYKAPNPGVWQVYDQSTATGAPAIGSISSPLLAGNVLHLYALGTNGHLLEFSKGPGAWQEADVSAATGITQALGGTPAPVLAGSAIHIYVIGSSSHLLEFYNGSGSWQVFDLSSALGTTPVPMSGVPRPWFDGNAMHVYVIGSVIGSGGTFRNPSPVKDHLLEFFKAPNPAPWKVYDQSAAVGGLTTIRNLSAPVLVGNALHIYAAGWDNHLYEFIKDSGPWRVFDPSAATGGTQIVSVPAAIFTGGSMHVYATGLNSNLLEFFKAPDPAPWRVYYHYLQ